MLWRGKPSNSVIILGTRTGRSFVIEVESFRGTRIGETRGRYQS